MKIQDFRPAEESDFPKIQDKEIFMAIGPVQKATKDLVRMSQKSIGIDNLNEEILQVELVPDTWTTIESNVKGIQGAQVILVDYSGLITGTGVMIVDDTHFKVRVKLTADSGELPNEVTVRIWVKGK